MFNNPFRSSVSRAYHESALLIQRDQLIAMMVESADERVKAIEAERDALKEAVIASGVHAGEVISIAERALTLLQHVVNAPRSGSKQWREDREALFADAMLAGLWER